MSGIISGCRTVGGHVCRRRWWSNRIEKFGFKGTRLQYNSKAVRKSMKVKANLAEVQVNAMFLNRIKSKLENLKREETRCTSKISEKQLFPAARRDELG